MRIGRYDRRQGGNLQGVGIRKNIRVFDGDPKWQIWLWGWLIEI